MARALAHRGPDSEGIWHDERGAIGLAHRRLSIQDVSPLGHQPMHSRGDRFVIAYNGEIYNFLEIRAELEKQGATFRGNSDTEVFLAALESWGVEQSLHRLIGMFAFALWDKRNRQLYLARDRMGEKPLYFGWQGKSFVFGSELKAFRACRDWTGEINRSVVPLYLRFNYIPTPLSIYQNVFKLTPGTFLRLSDRGATSDQQIFTYWSAEQVFEDGATNLMRISPEEVVDELDVLLRRSVQQQMISDVPLGAFLSGGIDSSTVVALMQSIGNSPVKTFTIGFEIPGYDEAKQAKQVSRHLATDHTELYLSPQHAMDVIPKLGEMYDEPFADSSQIPTYLVSKLARSQVTVSLSGDGGDELFCGYDRYFDFRDQWRRRRNMPRAIRRAVAIVGLMVPEPLADFALYPIMKAFTTKQPATLGRRFHKRMHGWLLEDIRSYYRHGLSLWTNPEELVWHADETWAPFGNESRALATADPLRQLMHIDATTYLPDDILVKVDRAAMAVSLETRIPFLDHRIVEFASRVPTSVHVKDSRGKWALRNVLYRYMPRRLVDRPKSGFAIPIADWLKGPLRQWAQELLDVRRLQRDGIFNPEFVSRAWRQYLAGGDESAHCRLWGILMFQSWMDAMLGHCNESKLVACNPKTFACSPL
jgi:asparagine synthase (glutamine-hydrolysing)